MQKVELVKFAPVSAQAAECVAGLEQRHIERLAVESHGGVKAPHQFSKAQKHLRFVAVVAQYVLLGDEFVPFDIGRADEENQRARATGQAVVSVSRKRHFSTEKPSPAPSLSRPRLGRKSSPSGPCGGQYARRARRAPASPPLQRSPGRSLAASRADRKTSSSPPSLHFRRIFGACQALRGHAQSLNLTFPPPLPMIRMARFAEVQIWQKTIRHTSAACARTPRSSGGILPYFRPYSRTLALDLFFAALDDAVRSGAAADRALFYWISGDADHPARAFAGRGVHPSARH